jgi:2-polyprenyl-6-methoxyphenol hydroxylase-like FAD-dependent oxidoreductase
MSKSYAVIGAGNGGYAMAGELALLGRDIVLFDFPAFEDRLSPLRKAGGVRVDSRIDHFPGGAWRAFCSTVANHDRHFGHSFCRRRYCGRTGPAP